MRVRRTALGAATSECRTKPIAASCLGSGYNPAFASKLAPTFDWCCSYRWVLNQDTISANPRQAKPSR